MKWLKNIDMDLSALESKSQSRTDFKKMRKAAKSYHLELENKASKLEYVDKASAYIMQRADPSDAAKIEQNVTAFYTLYDQVAARVATLLSLEKPAPRVSMGKVCGTSCNPIHTLVSQHNVPLQQSLQQNDNFIIT